MKKRLFVEKTYFWGLLCLVGLYLFGCSSPVKRSNDELKVINILDKIAIYQQDHITWIPDSVKGNHHDYGISAWTNAVFYIGLSKWSNSGKTETNYSDWLLNIGNTAHWKLAANFKDYPRYQLYHADEMCMGQFYLIMFDKYKDSLYISDTKDRADWIINNPADTTMSHRNKQVWSWCDALFMAPPVYAQLSKITGEPAYLRYMHNGFVKTYNHLYNKENNLFFRDGSYFDKQEENGEKVFWGRGNGWIISGLANLLEIIPDDYEHRSFYENLFKELAYRLAGLQNQDGFWHASLLDPASYPSPETSATALITHGIAYGINKGLLGSDYIETVRKAWNALSTVVNEEGKVGYVQPIGADPKKVTAEMTSVYGPGAFLMAGIEVLELIEKGKL